MLVQRVLSLEECLIVRSTASFRQVVPLRRSLEGILEERNVGLVVGHTRYLTEKRSNPPPVGSSLLVRYQVPYRYLV